MLKDLCELTNYSRYHFIRIFKKELGETPYEFINRFRVNHSKTLLTESGQAIETIARMVGFSDTNNYIIAFRKYTGMTPGQYRKEN